MTDLDLIRCFPALPLAEQLTADRASVTGLCAAEEAAVGYVALATLREWQATGTVYDVRS